MGTILSRYIQPGNRLELKKTKRLRKGEEDEQSCYTSQLVDIISDDRIEITMPMERTKLIVFPIDGEYDVDFLTTNGLYQCCARVVDRYKKDKIYLLQLELTSNLRKYQRREYYRFSCALEMNSRQLEEEEVLAIEKNKDAVTPELPLHRSVIADISGGGLRFVAEYAYEIGSIILCKYSLWVDGENKEYSLYGKVLSVRPVENKKGFYEHRVQYVNMDKDNREEIIKYIFSEERKAIRMRSDI